MMTPSKEILSSSLSIHVVRLGLETQQLSAVGTIFGNDSYRFSNSFVIHGRGQARGLL